MRPIPNDRLVLLATPIVYGFSLKDKMWRKHNYARVKDSANGYTPQSGST